MKQTQKYSGACNILTFLHSNQDELYQELNRLGYHSGDGDNATPLQLEFFNASINAEEARKQAAIKAEQDRKRQRQVLIGVLSTGLLLTTTTTGFAAYQWQSAERGRIEQTAITAKNLLSNYSLKGMVSAISAVGQSQSPFLNFSNQSFPQSILDSLFSAVEISREKNLFKGHQGYATSVAISTDGQTILSGGSDGTVSMWNRKGQPQGEPFKGHQNSVYSVVISTDGQTILSGGLDGTVRMWDIKFDTWLKTACERLADHPVFKNPESADEKKAKETCEAYLR